LIAPAILASAGAAAETAKRTASAVDPFSLYGADIYFDVYREGDKVGFHRTRFAKTGEDLIVNTTFQLQIDVLFFTAYRYLYKSESRWRNGRLESLRAAVDDDGTTSFVSASTDSGGIKIRNAEGTVAADAPLYPTNHWNAAVLSQSRVLNTLTGRVNDVRIVPQRRETVATERGNVQATHHLYTGDLATEVWYDDEGRWVKMRFKARDGSTIEYACRRCQGPRIKKAQR
jgi:hypothetical protein